jgi:aldos-2-ulose dehydratase
MNAVGHFTTNEYLQVMGVPIIAQSSDLDSPAPIIIFSPTYGPDGPVSWSKDIAFASEFRLIHDLKLLPNTNDGLDMVLVAGREGIVLLWFDQEAARWDYNVVGTGLPRSGDNPYWGSGSVDVAKVGDDPVGYIATCEVRAFSLDEKCLFF